MYDENLLAGGVFLIVFGAILLVAAPRLAKWPSAFLNALEEGPATVVTRVVGASVLAFGILNIMRALF